MLRLLHLAVFGVAAVGCGAALLRTTHIAHDETRHGLAGLLVASGVWAASQLVTFLDVPVGTATVAYELGLVSGLASVGAWLYFCSAYSGHDYHRVPAYRYTALALFGGIVLVKLTNPVHGLYFAVEQTTTPFRYQSIELHELHWLVTGLVYSLTAIGLYVLFESFARSGTDTTLTGLLGLTAVPVVLNVFSLLGAPWLVSLNYEPLGVAAFAIGALYVTEDTFEEIRWTNHRQLLDSINEAVVVVDDGGSIRTFNDSATDLLEGVEQGADVGRVLSNGVTAPERAVGNGSDPQVLAVDREDERRYYLVKETGLTLGPAREGKALVISDVTALERQRREIERQSEQLEGFSAAVAHELRNTLGIADGTLTLLEEAVEADDDALAMELLERTDETTERMIAVVDDLVRTARLGRPVMDPEAIELSDVAREGFAAVDSREMSLTVSRDGCVQADRGRLVELVETVVRLADETDASELTVDRTGRGFRFRTDGDSLPDGDTEALFEYGRAVPHAEAGMLGPLIRTLVRAHGYEVSASNRTPVGFDVDVTCTGPPTPEMTSGAYP